LDFPLKLKKKCLRENERKKKNVFLRDFVKSIWFWAEGSGDALSVVFFNPFLPIFWISDIRSPFGGVGEEGGFLDESLVETFFNATPFEIESIKPACEFVEDIDEGGGGGGGPPIWGGGGGGGPLIPEGGGGGGGGGGPPEVLLSNSCGGGGGGGDSLLFGGGGGGGLPIPDGGGGGGGPLLVEGGGGGGGPLIWGGGGGGDNLLFSFIFDGGGGGPELFDGGGGGGGPLFLVGGGGFWFEGRGERVWFDGGKGRGSWGRGGLFDEKEEERGFNEELDESELIEEETSTEFRFKVFFWIADVRLSRCSTGIRGRVPFRSLGVSFCWIEFWVTGWGWDWSSWASLCNWAFVASSFMFISISYSFLVKTNFSSNSFSCWRLMVFIFSSISFSWSFLACSSLIWTPSSSCLFASASFELISSSLKAT